MKEDSGSIVNQFTNFMSVNPHYGYLIAAAGFIIFFLGYLLRWSWVINPEGNPRSVFIYEIFGKETMRKIMIVVTAAVALICFGAFFLSKPKMDSNKEEKKSNIEVSNSK